MLRMVVTDRFMAPSGPSSGATRETSRKNTYDGLWSSNSAPASGFLRTQARIICALTSCAPRMPRRTSSTPIDL